jgi:uncharacterized membrane protein
MNTRAGLVLAALILIIAILATVGAVRRQVAQRAAMAADSGAYVAVRDLLAQRCAYSPCHSQESQAGKLDLSPDNSYSALVGVRSVGMSSAVLVVPGEPQHSYLLFKLHAALRPDSNVAIERPHTIEEEQDYSGPIKGRPMPLGSNSLAPEELRVIAEWIADGAGQ